MTPPEPVTAARDAFADYRARLAADPMDADPHLVALLNAHGADTEALRPFARRCATDLDAAACETNLPSGQPQLRRFDGRGNRVEAVVFHPANDVIGRAVWEAGVMARYAAPGRELETLALTYLLGQNGEAGHCCPLACTAGMIKILQGLPADEAPPQWLARLLDPRWEHRWHASQFLTEVQGGSDVGANALIARQGPAAPLVDGPDAALGTWRLYGEKWFCSVIDARLFLVTARPEGAAEGTAGLAAFVVPRQLPDGRPNGFAIRRLKDKLGTRSMASAEVDFEGALALRVADFRRTVEVVLNTSRLYNAVVAAGFLQRAWREADAYARCRLAFGQPILRFPSVARTVAALRAEAYAARASSFALAACADRLATGRAAEGEAGVYRFLVNCNKIWTALTCPAGVRQAIEVLGGNGAIEEFSVLPRLLRDALVIEAWEGGHGVLCAQIARDCRKLGLHRAAFAWLRAQADAHGGVPAGFDAAAERFARVMEGAEAEAHARDVIEELRPLAQACLLHAAGDPVEAAARAHLLAITARGWDPLADADLARRVAVLTA